MSKHENTELLERAMYWAEVCTDTSLGDQILALKTAGDLESLAVKVKEAEDYHRMLDQINDERIGDEF